MISFKHLCVILTQLAITDSAIDNSHQFTKPLIDRSSPSPIDTEASTVMSLEERSAHSTAPTPDTTSVQPRNLRLNNPISVALNLNFTKHFIIQFLKLALSGLCC